MKHAILISCLCLCMTASAKVVVDYSYGNVTVQTADKPQTHLKAKKGMQLSPTDRISIGSGAVVRIQDNSSSCIYECSQKGSYTIPEFEEKAKANASNHFKTVTREIRNTASSKNNHTIYKRCASIRAVSEVDPEADSIEVDPQAIASHFINCIINGENKNFPIIFTSSPTEQDEVEFRLDNTLDFPIYFNVLRYAKDNPQDVRMSAYGQPVGPYILLPGQSILRAQTKVSDPEYQHVIIATQCYFDVYDVLDNILMLFQRNNMDDIQPFDNIYMIGL